MTRLNGAKQTLATGLAVLGLLMSLGARGAAAREQTLQPYQVNGVSCRNQVSSFAPKVKPSACKSYKRLTDTNNRRNSKISAHIVYAFRAGYGDDYCPTDECTFSDMAFDLEWMDGFFENTIKIPKDVNNYIIPKISNRMVVVVFSERRQVVINCFIVEKSLNRTFYDDLKKCFDLEDLDSIR